MKAGGMVLPLALTQQTVVVSVPLSADDTWPTCLTFFAATTRGGTWTVVKAVSSVLYIL